MSLLVEDYLDEFEKFFDLLFTNTDEAVVKFTAGGLVARNMDSERITAYTLSAPPQSFYFYRIDKEAFGILSNRSKVKGVIRALRATGANRAVIKRKDNKIMLAETEIGEFEEEKTDFDAPEFKIDLPNRIAFDGRPLKRFLAQARKAGADAVGFAWTLAKREAVASAFNEEVWLAFKDLFGLEIVQDAGAGYKIHLVEQFLPPTIFLRKGWPVVRILGARAYRMPLGIEYQFGTVSFKAYVAPNYDDSARFLEKLRLLKALTKEDILRQVEKKAPTAVSSGEIEEALAKEGYEIAKVEEMLRQLVKEGKLNIREAGWKKLYFLPERPPVLKPLTEDVVLTAIRDFLEAADTDAVGCSELESFLAREYLTEPLHNMLLGLKAKGLVESKPWPTRRPGGYAVDMRGYWTIKPTEPKEAVEKAEEIKRLKPLTRDNVLSVLTELNKEFRKEVIIQTIERKLEEDGYSIEGLNDILVGLQKEGIVEFGPGGRWWVKQVVEELERVKPPAVPTGYARVRFLRDMVRFIGTDRKVYGPFRAHEEAVIPTQHAEIFEKHRYIEVIEQGVANTHSSSNPQTPFMDMEKQPITIEYKLLEYGVLE
ncbi:MAG: hypothetical protein OEY22_02295 [Candidatus Bathyarchaeota archaeon]|nr:hypothetical protein [Candidatus Bathyarchaeota archaeon]